MKAMDPNQVPLIKALDDNVSKVTIDSREGCPEFRFSTPIAVDGALSYVIHTVFSIFRGVVGFVLRSCVSRFAGLGVDAS